MHNLKLCYKHSILYLFCQDIVNGHKKNLIESVFRYRSQKVSGPRLFLSFPQKRESMASCRLWTLAFAKVTREEASEKSGRPAFDSL